MIKDMALVIACICYAAVVAASYYLAARTARPIPFPDWVFEKDHLQDRRDERRAA